MQNSETTMPATKSELEPRSTEVKTVEILHAVLAPLSESSKVEKSTLENMLEDSSQRLYNLMHSQMETHEKAYLSEEGSTRPLEEWQVKSVIDVSRELREVMKLRIDVAKLKKDILLSAKR